MLCTEVFRRSRIMEEHREKILQTRTLKRKVVKLILSVLGQGIRVCRNFDEEVRAEFDLLPENFVLIIGIWGSRHPLILQSRKDGVHRIHESVSSLVKNSLCRRLSAAGFLWSSRRKQECWRFALKVWRLPGGWLRQKFLPHRHMRVMICSSRGKLPKRCRCFAVLNG